MDENGSEAEQGVCDRSVRTGYLHSHLRSEIRAMAFDFEPTDVLP